MKQGGRCKGLTRGNWNKFVVDGYDQCILCDYTDIVKN